MGESWQKDGAARIAARRSSRYPRNGGRASDTHSHASNQFMFCLEGKYEYTKVTLTPGCFYCNPKGKVHGPAVAHEDTVVIEMYDGPHYPQVPDWYTDPADAR